MPYESESGPRWKKKDRDSYYRRHPNAFSWADREREDKNGLRASFWKKVEKTETCWNWLGAKTKRGYGFATYERKKVMGAHRLAYIKLVGPISAGMQIDHLCRNPRCVNPAHLEAVTPKKNTLRSTSISAVNAQKSHCLHGHAFTAENIYQPPGTHHRHCKACQREAKKSHNARMKAARHAAKHAEQKKCGGGPNIGA